MSTPPLPSTAGSKSRTKPMSRPVALSPLVIVAVVVTMLAWASAFIVIRGVGPYFSGGSLALARLTVGSVLLGVIALTGRRWITPTRREWLLIIGFGVAWFAAYNVSLNIAEQTLDAGTTAMLVGIGPVLIALGATTFLGERMSKWLAIGAGVAFLGVLLIGFGTGGGSLGDGSGVLWSILAAVTYAAGVLMQKSALKRLPAAQVTWLAAVIGTLACLPFAGQLGTELATAPWWSLVGAVYLGAVPTALAFSTWAYALSRLPAGQLGVSTYAVPPITILLGFLAFGEVPALIAALGGAVSLVGVGLSRRRSRAGDAALAKTRRYRGG